MALLRWGYDEEEEKDQFGQPQIQSVQSVQDTWQPTGVDEAQNQQNNNGIFAQSNTQQPDNSYLMSAEKAQRDEQQRQRRAAEEAARAQAAAQAEMARQAAAARAAQAAQAAQPQALDAEAIKNDDGWKRYYDSAFQKEKSQQGFLERLLDNGSASRRAEVAARNKYTSEMLNQAYDENFNVRDAAMANRASAFANYNSAFAQNNSLQSQALSRAIGASRDNPDQNVFDRMKSTANAIKNMSLYDATVGVNDTTRANFDDAGRFLGNLVQGIPTMPIIGSKELLEMGIGRGTDAETGFERDLNMVERGGRGLSGALNVALPFVTGGGVRFVDDLFGAVANGTATQTQKALLTQTLKKAASGAATQGVLGGAQASGEWVGNGGSFLNEKGELDIEQIKDYVAQVAPATALSAAGGVVFAGGGNALRHLRGRNNANATVRDSDLTPTQDVADGVAQPGTPEPVPQDGNVSFEPIRTQPSEPNYTPIAENFTPEVTQPRPEPAQPPQPRPEPIADDIPNLPEQTPVESPMDNVELEPVRQPETATPAEVPPVADGTPAPRPVPATDANMPTIRSEEVRQLQEARAGTTQAEEAAINRELQQIQNQTPRVDETPDGSINDKLFDDATASDNAKIKEFSRIRQSSGSDENLYDTLLNYEGDSTWLRSAAAYAGRMHEAQGVPLKDIFDDIAEPLPSARETASSRLSATRDDLVKSIRDLEKSTGQKGLYNQVSSAMRGMTEQQQVDFMGKAMRDMRERGVLAADFVNRQNNYTPASARTPDVDTPRIEADDEFRSSLLPEYLPGSPSKPLELNSRIHKIDVPRMLREAELSQPEIDSVMGSLFKNNKNVSYKRIRQAVDDLDDTPRVDKSEAGVDKAGTLTRESTDTLVENDGWKSYRDNTIKRYERRILQMEARGSNRRHIKGMRDNLKALKASKPNEVYRVNSTTGKAEVHPASELLKSFSKAMGEDVPPIAIGNVAERGSTSRLPANWAGANGTYVSHLSRLDYKTKNSVYHETMHHIDHFIRGYQGDNPKMQELRKLRDDITLEDMKKFKAVDWRADNKAEYVAHAMDALLDGRIKAGQLGASVLKYIKSFFGSVKEALSSSHVYGRTHNLDELADYVKRLDAIIHDAGTKPPKQKPLTPGELKPETGNLPPSMGGDAPTPKPKSPKPKPDDSPFKLPDDPKPAGKTPAGDNYLQRTVSGDASTKDVKRRLAGVSEVKDIENLDEILDNIPKITPKIRQRIEDNYSIIEKAEKRINAIQKEFRKDLSSTNTQNVPMERAEQLHHERNRLVQDMQMAEKNLQSTIRRLESRQSLKQRALNSASNIVSFQQGNMLTSLPVQEKNIIGDIIATVTHAVRHPVQMATNIPQARLGSELKKVVREANEIRPQTLSEVPRYLIRTTLSPVYAINNSLSNVRGGVYRNTLARAELVKGGVKNPTSEQIRLQAMRAGNAREIIVNLNKNVGATIADPYKATKAADEYFKVLENSTSHKELAQFAENTRASSGILQELIRPSTNGGKVTPMSLLINTIYPFTNPAINAAKKAVYQLDPRKASQVNEMKKVIQSPTEQNMSRLAKAAGTATSIAAIVSLLNEGVIDYNDEDASGDVSKPRGWSIKVPDGVPGVGGTYMPVRAFGVFEPFIVATGVTYKVMNGEIDNVADAAAMAASSLPVMGTNEFYAQGAREWAEGDVWGYGTQSQVVSRTKNLVPFVNNGLDRWMDRNQGKSSDATSAYVSKKNDKGETVPDFMPWLGNSIRAGFGDKSGLKPSYTPAGQVRTADNQGAFVNKTINDKNTKTHNSTISDLVKYARETELGKGMGDMFNTYDTGKNNNFKSVQDSITWLDVEDGGKPENKDKLEHNEKLAELNQQIFNGFFGDSAPELLKLDGKELRSDVSMPNKNNSGKNSNLPISVATIRNAIAQTDLPQSEWAKLNEISSAKSALAERAKAKEIGWSAYYDALPEFSAQENAILANSPNAQKLGDLMTKLHETGFFEDGGIGSTKSGQTYLWNSLNALLGSKGKTPAAAWDSGSGSGFKPWGRGGGGSKASNKPGKSGTDGIKWTPVQARQMAKTSTAKYTPFNVKVKLGNEVKRNKTQNYADRSF